ncbi:MAG: HTH domain-containing protein [Ilumatobacteraceae bacterium]
MRAGRLLNLMMALQQGRRLSAADLAQRLEVSERTVLRDIEVLSGAGVPVYATRGPGGGFELLDTFRQVVPPVTPGLSGGAGRIRRVGVRIEPGALQLALLTGQPEGWRARATAVATPDRPHWVEGSFRFHSYDTAARQLTALLPDVEVLRPASVRSTMESLGRTVSTMHRDPGPPTG